MRDNDVEIHIEHIDALSVSADVLVLKYAQKLHGVDRAVVTELAVDREKLPKNGEALTVPARGKLGVRDVLFLGVPTLHEFGYREIREFAGRVLPEVADQHPGAVSVAMTINGPGYGLDEVEAFQSQVAGVLEALDTARLPSRLKTVVFAERNELRVQRLQRLLDDLVPGNRVPARGVDEDTSRTLRSVGYDAERMDEIYFSGDIITEMKARVDAASLVIADLTDNNANVYLEVGYAWGRDIPTLFVYRKAHKVLFDVRGHQIVRYETAHELAAKLNTVLPAILSA